MILKKGKFYQVYLLPILIAFGNGVLSIFGVNNSLEMYFWIIAIVTCGVLLGLKKFDHFWIDSFIAGVLIAAATGIPQVLFMDTYFTNNPEYLEAARTLPMNPKLYTFLMISIFGIAIGILILLLSFILTKLTTK